MRLVKPWNRLPQEASESAHLEMLKIQWTGP